MKGFWKFLKDVHSKGNDSSSKRFYGGIGYICAIVFIALWSHGLIKELLFVSAGLLGVGLINDMKKND